MHLNPIKTWHVKKRAMYVVKNTRAYVHLDKDQLFKEFYTIEPGTIVIHTGEFGSFQESRIAKVMTPYGPPGWVMEHTLQRV